MKINSQTSAIERLWAESGALRALVLLVHPVGVFLWLLVVFFCTLIAAKGFPLSSQLVSILASSFFFQCSVEIANDIADRELDALAKPWRPIPAGLIKPQAATALAVACGVLAVILAAMLSIWFAALLSLCIIVGVAYSLWLKSTVFSWLPYVVVYPSIFVWAWISLGQFEDRLLATYFVTLPWVLASHLSNQLRDFDEDISYGVTGFIHTLGKKRATDLCMGLLILAPFPLLLCSNYSHSWSMILLLAAVVHWSAFLFILRGHKMHPGVNSMRNTFRLTQVSGPLLTLIWLAINH